MVLNMKTECDRLLELIFEYIDKLSSRITDLTLELGVVESSLAIGENITFFFIVQRVTSLEH